MGQAESLIERFHRELESLVKWARRFTWGAVVAGAASGLAALLFLAIRTGSVREIWYEYRDLVLFLCISGGLVFSLLAWLMRWNLARLVALEASMNDIKTTDPLTHVFNRYRMMDDLERLHDHSRAHGSPYALLMIDIDNLRWINDSLAHAAGDAIIRQLADRIRSHVRKGEHLYRYGGEEFVVLAENTTAASAMQLAERLRGVVEASSFHWLDRRFKVTVSIGIAAYGGQSAKPSARVLAAADAALSRAKQYGRNRVQAEPRIVRNADTVVHPQY